LAGRTEYGQIRQRPDRLYLLTRRGALLPRPAYGAHKAGLDKLAADMGVDFESTGIGAVSIWMGRWRPSACWAMMADDPEKYGHLEEALESSEFTGHVIWALYNDPKLAKLSGQTLIGAELGQRYAITDRGGRSPKSARDSHKVAIPADYSLAASPCPSGRHRCRLQSGVGRICRSGPRRA